MKKIIILIVLMFLISCSGYDRAGCFSTVQKAFPEGKVVPITKGGYIFVVIFKSGAVWYVETGNNFDTQITLRRQID